MSQGSQSQLQQQQQQDLSEEQAVRHENGDKETKKTDQKQQSEETTKFAIRTLNRRHIDFDPVYDLGNPTAPGRSAWNGAFVFVQGADSQFGMIDSYTHKRTEPGWKEEMELCEQLIDICTRMKPKPKFLVICGDLVDAWPKTELRQRQMTDFKRIFARLGCHIPLVCVCGNHDVGDEPTMDSIAEYRENFGDDYFYFTTNDVLFIVINSQFYQNRTNVRDYANEQDRWLEDLLAKCNTFKHTVVFEHVPWFLVSPTEDDDYFNIKNEVRMEWLQKFSRAGVRKIFCGHYHRNAGGWFGPMEVVVTTAIGAQMGWDQSGVRLVRVLEDSIEHDYYAMKDVPCEIKLD